MMRALVLAALLLPLVSAGTEPHAVVLLYHHVDDSTPASTSVSPQVFEQHLDWLEEHDYEVWPLERLVYAFVDGDRKSTRLNSSHVAISYAVFCLKRKKC